MKVPIRPAPPPPVNANAPQKVSKTLTTWNGSVRANQKAPMSVQKKKPPPRPPPPKFNQKQDKKHIPARPSQLITSLFHKKNNNSSTTGEPILKPTPEVVDNKGNNVLSLIDFNSPPSSPTFTTRSSSDALSVNSFGSDGVTPCSTSSGNTSNVESGFEDDFDFFLGSTAKKPDNQVKDPWSCQDQRQKNPSPLYLQNQKLNNKNNSLVAFSSTSTTKKNEFSAMPTIIRVKPERPKLPVKVTNSVPTSNVNVLAEIFNNSHETLVNTGQSLLQKDEDDDDNDDDEWSSESPPMPTCPPPAPPLEVLQSLLNSSPEVLVS